MILVDSSVWIDYFNGAITPQTEKLDSLLGRQPLAIGDLILTEVLQGFASERDFNAGQEDADLVDCGGAGRAGNRDSSGQKLPRSAQALA